MSNPLANIVLSAQQNIKDIILVESEQDRVLLACHTLNQQKIANPILLGDKVRIYQQAKKLNIDAKNFTIIDEVDTEALYLTAKEIYTKKNKPFDDEIAQNLLADKLSLAALMLENNQVDGCVAGVSYSTAAVLKTAFSLIGPRPDTSTISGAFIMSTPDGRVFIFADCAVVADPDSQQLAEIASASAKTAEQLLKISPKVALLSFSTKGSAQHKMVDKVMQALHIVKAKNPDLCIDGELQLDSAICPDIAKLKTANSVVAGQANVLIFPNLDAGNIGYKIMQRLGGAQAVGPILQGINKPMNDLSRGASVTDIVNMVAVTAVQSHYSL